MASLVVPGVRVEARFDVLPPLPAPSGILGAVGIVDRPPSEGALVAVTKVSELRQLLGPGTEATMPQVIHALGSGASEAVISAVSGGTTASLSLRNSNSEPCVALRCRAPGAWGNELAAEIRDIADAGGQQVRVTLRILRRGQEAEIFEDLRVSPGEPDDFFDVVNRRSRLVVAIDPGFADAVPAAGTFVFSELATVLDVPESGGAARTLMQLLPADEIEPAGLSVVISPPQAGAFTVEVHRNGLQERFTGLLLNPDSDRYLPYVLLTQSRFVRVRPLSSMPEGSRLPSAAANVAQPRPFAGGGAPTVQQYRDAIDRLADDPRIDLVVAACDPGLTDAQVRQIHQQLAAHSTAMADAGAPRIAFGSITAAEDQNNDGRLGRIRDHAASSRSRRFVLCSPAGSEGAVAGLIGRMNPQDSPTFKPCPLFDLEAARYRASELDRLLGSSTNLLVVQDRVGRGVVVLKGIDTTGDQISVTRVADQATRETKAIAENFIGRLNSEDARVALKQQIVATFLRMERAGALVPSTDGKDPAFLVDVYSTQQDFAQGIVRIDIAVRPVRAIDYIYATIRVKN